MNATLPPPKATHPPKKVAVIRARCDDTLPVSVEDAARVVGFEPPDFIRFVLANTAEVVAKGGKSAFFRLYAAA